MKNLLIYVNPAKDFVDDGFGEAQHLIKIQIDNSLELGWDRDDIMLVTNFDYEYNGVKALVVSDDNFCSIKPTATKIDVIVTLFNSGLIGEDLYWFHDLDAFQLEEIVEVDFAKADMSLTDYGRSSINRGRDLRWSTGSIFFWDTARDIFELIKDEVYRYKANEEIVLLEILKKKRNQPLKKRIEKINITYNFATRMRDIIACYEMADKPLKVIHFHPFDKRKLHCSNNNNMEFCVYGENELGKPLVTDRLIRIFNKHGIK